jgi:hypothetical protein
MRCVGSRIKRPRGHRREDAGRALDAEVAVSADGLGDQAHHGLRAVDVELVHDQMPRGCGGARSEERGQLLREVLLGAGRTEAMADRAGDDVEAVDQVSVPCT